MSGKPQSNDYLQDMKKKVMKRTAQQSKPSWEHTVVSRPSVEPARSFTVERCCELIRDQITRYAMAGNCDALDRAWESTYLVSVRAEGKLRKALLSQEAVTDAQAHETPSWFAVFEEGVLGRGIEESASRLAGVAEQFLSPEFDREATCSSSRTVDLNFSGSGVRLSWVVHSPALPWPGVFVRTYFWPGAGKPMQVRAFRTVERLVNYSKGQLDIA